MRSCPPLLLLAFFGFIALAGRLNAQEQAAPTITKFVAADDESAGASLPPEELAIAMGQQMETTELDCSHFVQWLFEQAGLYYGYAPSRTLYAGMPGFKRVWHPRPGDLIVWPGHVGIVVDPEEKTFLSSLNSGVKTVPYDSSYWKRRGHPRFYRYSRKYNAPPVNDRQGHTAWGAE